MTETLRYATRIFLITIFYYTVICVFKEIKRYWTESTEGWRDTSI